VKLALSRLEILAVACCASNATRYLVLWDFSQIGLWGWFITITGILCIAGALFFPPRVQVPDGG
jgi:hypothetical protein